MRYSHPEQLCCPPVAGQTLRADVAGGALSSDFGALRLRGIDRQIGLTARLTAAIRDQRHPSSLDHPWRDLLAQRMYQLASGYADAKDANHLRRDPVCKLGLERRPWEAEANVARAPTCSRLEPQMDRKDLYRLTRAVVDHCLASDVEPPAAMVRDVDHSDAPTYGQPAVAFSKHHYQNHSYRPRCIFAGTAHALVTADRRPGPRPPGTDNAMILGRLVSYLRRHWPHPHSLVRGDRPCATPEVIEVLTASRWTDFGCGLAGQAVFLRQAAPTLEAARRLPHQRVALARAPGQAPPTRRRLYDACDYAAGSWAQPWRVILKAAVMRAGAHPRLVVPALEAPTPPMLSEDL